MTPAPTPIDPTRCPLCGGPNGCAMELERTSGQPQPACWCTRATFVPALLEQAPPAARGRACFCPSCVRMAAESAGP